MYVCHCRAVTDRRIKDAVAEGARDCASVGQRCGAGTHCGGCLPAMRALLAELGLSDDSRSALAAGHAA